MGIKEKVLMIATIAILLIMVGMACYSVFNKKQDQTDTNIINEIDLNETTEKEEQNEEEQNAENTENVVEENVTPTVQPEVTEEQINSDYVGVEEQESTNTAQTEEEKVIELVKQEYGTDQGISINIANKDGNIYHSDTRIEFVLNFIYNYFVNTNNLLFITYKKCINIFKNKLIVTQMEF